ncbi:MAG: MBL fold metallo-hydrolase [Planctomycetaceae bacterium]|nr:MBL fold metallo-hydrolase [Planctomycetaceae bacterium]
MYAIEPVGAVVGGECYLLTTKRSAVLLDTGFNFCADAMVDNLRAALGGRSLDLVLLTHSHYDHVGGSVAVRDAFPQARIVATKYAQSVFTKPNAIALMQNLDAGVAVEKGWTPQDDRITRLALDATVDDGDAVRLDDLTIRAVATPGHTRCCTSYFFEEPGLLVCSETLGVITRYPEVAPCLIIGARPTLDSIGRSRALEPKRVFVSHSGVLPEEDTEQFFDAVERVTREAVELVVSAHERGRSHEEIVDAFMDRFFGAFKGVQPMRAFLINTQALIPRILEEMGLAPRRSA